MERWILAIFFICAVISTLGLFAIATELREVKKALQEIKSSLRGPR